MKMRAKYFLIGLLVAGSMSFYGSMPLWADTYTINPSDDGSIYTCPSCNNGVINWQYLLVANDIQGVVKFPTAAIPSSNFQALLSVNPYGLPLWGPKVDVYGLTGQSGLITSSDANAGIYLGTWTLPAEIIYRQDAFFDVTEFLLGISDPYVGFNLRSPSGGCDVFSSLEYNYGHPAQLVISTPVPEPAAITLLLLGLAGLIGFRRAARG